ncbi:MAG: TIGR00730 family Rossman fold protein [Candidatus Obscuribacterales bacterium]|nr:TIGR00730 family Rossman fold protein [Candidatus Obscuribacterales bacterium]
MKSITVFCGASMGHSDEIKASAAEMGRLIARSGRTLVYGGGKVGLMGVIADAALSEKGTVIGVIPRFMLEREVAHEGLSELILVDTMHERKAIMADKADAFLAMPGGYGTLDELCEILTWHQIGLHRRPIGILNTMGYFDSLLTFFDDAVENGFIPASLRAILLEAASPDKLLALLEAHYTAVQPDESTART